MILSQLGCVYNEIQGSRDKARGETLTEGVEEQLLELEERERFRFHSLSPQEKEELLEKLRKELGKRGEIKLAIVHGSFLKDYPFRDIDVAVYVEGDINTLWYKIELEIELEDKIGYPIDIAILNEALQWFTEKVLKEGRTLIARQPLPERLHPKTAGGEQHSNKGGAR